MQKYEKKPKKSKYDSFFENSMLISTSQPKCDEKKRQLQNYDDTNYVAITDIHKIKRIGENTFQTLVKGDHDQE
jgi:hypothetical protein